MPIIFITGYGDVPMSVRAMKAGAVEFLTKPFGDEALLSAIRGALERSANRQETAADMQSSRCRYDLLSRREREVMALVVSGLSNKQIGAGGSSNEEIAHAEIEEPPEEQKKS